MTEENLENPTPELDADQTAKNEELSAEMKTALAQKEHFRAKAEKLEVENAKLRTSQPQNGNSIDALEITRLGKSISQYDDSETDYIIERAKGKFNTLNPTPNQIVEASKDEWTQSAILQRREKVLKEQALNPSNKQPDIRTKKSFEEELVEASLEDAEKMLIEKGLVKFPHRRHSPNVLREGGNN